MGDPIFHQNYADVELKGDTYLKTEDGTVFNVNSELLARHSKYFKGIFLMGEEAGQNTVIRGVKSDTFQTILTYMNTGKVLLTSENIVDVLVAADFLMIESLLDECKKFVVQDKKVENLIRYFVTANRIKGLNMEEHCRRFLVLSFEKAVMHSMDEACCLPYEELKHFLSHKSLNVSDEPTIWSVVEAWVQKEPEIRLSLVPGLLRCLSTQEIGDELASNILNSPIILNNKCFEDVGDPREAFDFSNDVEKLQSLISFRNELPIISGVRLPPFVHVVAKRFQDREGAELFLSYDDRLDLWRKVGDISESFSRLLVSGHSVYYLKRVYLQDYELTGSYYDLLRNEVKSMALPKSAGYITVDVGGCVYALDVFGFTNVQRYDHETDVWKDVGRVLYRGRISAVLNVNNNNGLLHILGHVEGSDRMYMWVYDPSTNEWGRAPPPNVPRVHAKAEVYKGMIFLIAGESTGRGHDVLFEEFYGGYKIHQDKSISLCMTYPHLSGMFNAIQDIEKELNRDLDDDVANCRPEVPPNVSNDDMDKDEDDDGFERSNPAMSLDDEEWETD